MLRLQRWMLSSMVLLGGSAGAAVAHAEFNIAQATSYTYVSQLSAAERADVIAWVCNVGGIRNVWIAHGPAFQAAQVTHYEEDDGQELTQLTFSPDGKTLLYVRGGDHDANWPAEGNLAPNPAASTAQPMTAIWSVPMSGGEPRKIDDADAPAISVRGQLAYIKDNQVWGVASDSGKPERLFFDRGKDRELAWSPDGNRLAFVSDRADHAFIGVYTSRNAPLLYLVPSTGIDGSPRWSSDGSRIAYVRRRGDGGEPAPLLKWTPDPWAIWVASSFDGSGRAVWSSPKTLAGSYPDMEGESNLFWASGGHLVFTASLDGWPHVYSLSADGGAPVLLTPGAFMVEHVTLSRDRQSVVYSANTGPSAADEDRRHLFRVSVERAGPTPLTSGDTLEWSPVSASLDRIAFISASAQQPPALTMIGLDASHRALLLDETPPFPFSAFVAPRPVKFQAADGTLIHGQLFESARTASADKPGVIFVHGGPSRQMLLGWHYMEYYSNAYAVNQYLAAHGFAVLSVNYRLGIGYGRGFHQPEHAGLAGAAEYQDVVAGAHFLQALPHVDASRIGIWGGSYGGFLTALGLARNSDIFKAGVDLHGVHDWSRLLDEYAGKPVTRFEKGDREKASEVAWNSSPDAALDGWKSPVLLIQGDDDRNVSFQQTVDLARRLEARGLPFEELVIPNEIHGFLRHASWLRADQATVDFFSRSLGH